jgi:hypothetical protein
MKRRLSLDSDKHPVAAAKNNSKVNQEHQKIPIQPQNMMMYPQWSHNNHLPFHRNVFGIDDDPPHPRKLENSFSVERVMKKV